MKPSTRLHAKTYFLILVMIVFGPLGNVLLSAGMKRIGAVTAWSLDPLLHTLGLVLTSGAIWLGIGSLLTFFVAYALVLSWADYSYVQPASSMAYGVVALLGYMVLGETVSPVRWVGIGVICLGVFIVGRTPPRTTRDN